MSEMAKVAMPRPSIRQRCWRVRVDWGFRRNRATCSAPSGDVRARLVLIWMEIGILKGAVIPGLVPAIQLSARSGARGTMDPGNECRDDVCSWIEVPSNSEAH
jgi:hypothetical protein